MVAVSRLTSLLLSILGAAFLAAGPAFAVAPVLDDPIQPDRVPANIPVGKTLLLPLTASDADGDALTYEVKSTDPKVHVRVKTGNPHLKLTINHAGAGTPADPAFSGVLEFQLLRDLTPITADIIAGFAHAGYYNGIFFHRITDLDSENPGGSFVAQGGDPLGTGTGGPGFIFDDELRAPLIFAGRGQLAMANSGVGEVSSYRGTNGSQFFITDNTTRFLDFNHTIFGQLVRGWDLLEKLVSVPTTSERPTVPVTITGATIEPNFTDAVLVLTAIGVSNPTKENIEVKVSDAAGGVAVKKFKATAIADTRNGPPFFIPPANVVGPKDTVIEIPLQVIDLEGDLLSYGNGLLDFPPHGDRRQVGSIARVAGFTGYTGPLTLAVAASQFDVSYRGRHRTATGALIPGRQAVDGNERDFDDFRVLSIGVGEREFRTEPVTLEAEPGVALTAATVATIVDRDPAGVPGNFVATINWGDHPTTGIPSVSAGTIVRDPSRAAPAAFLVQGTHTFAGPGVFPVTVKITGSLGFISEVRSTAIVTAATFRAAGRALTVTGSRPAQHIVATFTDTAPLPPADYLAAINWGDGTATAGVVQPTGPGIFSVTGLHAYRDPEVFSIAVRIHKAGAGDAVAWSTATVGGFPGVRHLPPFPQVRLSTEVREIVLNPNTQTPTFKPVQARTGAGTTLQTLFAVDVVVRNSGTKRSPGGALKFYLSRDKILNTNGADPDLPLTISTFKQIFIPSLAPDGVSSYRLDVNPGVGDFRLRAPAGETGIGYNILAALPYKDPIGDAQTLERFGIYGPIGLVAGPENFAVNENPTPPSGTAPHTQTIAVFLDETPAADVTIALSVSDARISLDKTQLVFTPANAGTPQNFVVTGVDDALPNGRGNSEIIFAPTVSTDPVWNGRTRANLKATVFDNDPPP